MVPGFCWSPRVVLPQLVGLLLSAVAGGLLPPLVGLLLWVVACRWLAQLLWVLLFVRSLAGWLLLSYCLSCRSWVWGMTLCYLE